MKQFDMSNINIYSNNKNFMEYNTDTELKNIFWNKKKNSKNNTLYNYLKKENLFHDYKTINITSYKKYNNISNDLIYL